MAAACLVGPVMRAPRQVLPHRLCQGTPPAACLELLWRIMAKTHHRNMARLGGSVPQMFPFWAGIARRNACSRRAWFSCLIEDGDHCLCLSEAACACQCPPAFIDITVPLSVAGYKDRWGRGEKGQDLSSRSKSFSSFTPASSRFHHVRPRCSLCRPRRGSRYANIALNDRRGYSYISQWLRPLSTLALPSPAFSGFGRRPSTRLRSPRRYASHHHKHCRMPMV